MNPAAMSALARGDLSNALVASTPGGIEAQEKQGQADLAREANRIPIRVSTPRVTIQQLAERLGIQLGEEVDDLFVSATLPQGWVIKPSEHAMWSDLCDEKGRVRASIFFKAAFYDKRAHIGLTRRYLIHNDFAKPTNTIGVKDGATGEIVHVAGVCGDLAYEEMDKVERAARVWLAANFPLYEDHFAYWD